MKLRNSAQTAAVLCSILLIGCLQPPAPPEPPPAPVRVSPVKEETVAQKADLLGTVVALRSSKVAAGAAGKVVQYPIREGDLIAEGDLLAELRSVTLQIEIEAARQTEQEKKARYDRLASGFRLEEIKQAEAAMRGAEAAYKYAKSVLERTEVLHERNAASDDDLLEAQSNEARTAELFAEAKALYELRQSGYRAEEIAEAKAAWEAQRQTVKQMEDELKKRTITAPYAGVVVEKHSEIGEWIEKGGSVAKIVDLSAVDVIVNVEESLMHLVRVGQPVDVRFDALPGQTYRGPIKEIVPQSSWQGGSRSFPVKVRLENKTDESGLALLKEGMVARVTLEGVPHEAILVHKDAIVRSSGEPVVFRLDEEDRAFPLPVQEGLNHGELIEVQADLSAGQRLVIEGNERLRPAQKVRILEEPAEQGPASQETAQEPPERTTAKAS